MRREEEEKKKSTKEEKRQRQREKKKEKKEKIVLQSIRCIHVDSLKLFFRVYTYACASFVFVYAFLTLLKISNEHHLKG